MTKQKSALRTSYTITVAGLKELDDPKSWSRSKLPLHLAETLLDGKSHDLESLLTKLKPYDTVGKIQGKLSAWVRMGWLKKSEAGGYAQGNRTRAANVKRTKQAKPATETAA